jgi:hypothetical protein
LRPVDQAPFTEEQSIFYRFAQRMRGPILHLPKEQIIRPPFTADEPLAPIYINTNDTIELQNQRAWTLNEQELQLLGLLRLRSELTVKELLALGFHPYGPSRATREARVNTTIRKLAGLLNIDEQRPMLTHDYSRSVRLARPVVFFDRRPAEEAVQPDTFSKLAAYVTGITSKNILPPANTTKTRAGSLGVAPWQRTAIELIGPAACAAGNVELREMCVLSLRTGIWFPQMRHTEVITKGGMRVPYAQFREQLLAGKRFISGDVGAHLGYTEEGRHKTAQYNAIAKIDRFTQELLRRGDMRAVLVENDKLEATERLQNWKNGKTLDKILAALQRNRESEYLGLFTHLLPNTDASNPHLVDARAALPQLRDLLDVVHKTIKKLQATHSTASVYPYYDTACNYLWKLLGRPGDSSTSYNRLAAANPQFAQTGQQALADLGSLLVIYKARGRTNPPTGH